MFFPHLLDEKTFDRICKIRREIHEWPELAFEEYKTSALIAKELESLGIPYESGVGKTGIVARLNCGNPLAPTVALRADMDALSLVEETGLPFASRVKGRMHACGHDGHVAMLLGAAMLLKKNPPPGNVVFLFQPAEEGGGGAQLMIQAGALNGVDAIFGGHIDLHRQVGEVVAHAGVNSAFTDEIDIIIKGKGGHAARPHETVDAVVVASVLVVTIQTIISRQIDPTHPSVISIGYLCAGSARNVIAEHAEIKGTVRTTDNEIRKEIFTRVKRMTESMAALYGAEIKINVIEGYPPVINTPFESKLAAKAAVKILGLNSIKPLGRPILGGEDFAFFLQHVPGCFLRIGAAKPGHEHLPSHSPRFDFNEEALRIGARCYDEIVRTYIEYKRHIPFNL